MIHSGLSTNPPLAVSNKLTFEFCFSDQQIHAHEQAEVFLCRGHQIRGEETYAPNVPVHTSGNLGYCLSRRDVLVHCTRRYNISNNHNILKR